MGDTLYRERKVPSGEAQELMYMKERKKKSFGYITQNNNQIVKTTPHFNFDVCTVWKLGFLTSLVLYLRF